MMSDLKRKEEELYNLNTLIDKLQEERRVYILMTNAEKKELQWQISCLNKRLLEETDGKTLDIPHDENGEEKRDEDLGSQN